MYSLNFKKHIDVPINKVHMNIHTKAQPPLKGVFSLNNMFFYSFLARGEALVY